MYLGLTDGRVWVCKLASGQTFIRAYIYGVFESTDPATIAELHFTDLDNRVSPFYVSVHDHPLRYVAMPVINARDGLEGLMWAGISPWDK